MPQGIEIQTTARQQIENKKCKKTTYGKDVATKNYNRRKTENRATSQQFFFVFTE